MLKGTTISSYLPMSSGNSNPILRRLGVEGVGTSGHFTWAPGTGRAAGGVGTWGAGCGAFWGGSIGAVPSVG